MTLKLNENRQEYKERHDAVYLVIFRFYIAAISQMDLK